MAKLLLLFALLAPVLMLAAGFVAGRGERPRDDKDDEETSA
jgi:hypothetical protein